VKWKTKHTIKGENEEKEKIHAQALKKASHLPTTSHMLCSILYPTIFLKTYLCMYVQIPTPMTTRFA